MAGYNNNHLRFGERCCIQIFYRSRQREGGQENMCYRNFPLEMRVRGEGLVYLSLNRLAISYEEPGPLPGALYSLYTRPSHSLKRYGFVVLVGGLQRATGYSPNYMNYLLPSTNS